MNRMLQRLSVLILFLGCSFFSVAQNGHKIKVKINGLRDTTINLAYHFGSKQYLVDTILLDNSGRGIFEGKEPLPGGFYLVVLPRKNYFEIIVNEQYFSVENDTIDFQKNFKSTGTIENELFYQDMRFIAKKHAENSALQKQLEDAKEKDKTTIKEQLSNLNQEVKQFRKNIIINSPTTFYAKFLKTLEEPEVPDSPKDENGNLIDDEFSYKYYKSHYFDNIDFTDERLLRTPTFEKKVMTYFTKVISQQADSINAACDIVLNAAKPNEETFKFWLIKLLNKYAKSKIMGMDAVYVHLVEKYYNAETATWVSEDDLYRINERAKSLKPTLIGKVAPNMRLQDINKKSIPLHSVEAKYLVVYIYAPDCGHCKKETPHMVKTFKTVVDTMGVDLKIYAAPTMHLHKGDYDDNGNPIYSKDPKDLNEWPDFVKKYDMTRWINVADLYLHDNFREEYDVNSTPKLFLLDKNKKIIAKRFSSEQLLQIIKDLEKREDN